MNIKDITEGYFNKSDDERTEIINQIMQVYINDMIEQDGNLLLLRSHFMLMKEKAYRDEEYEVCEVLQQCIDGLTEVLNTLPNIGEQDNV
jgi:hypothetical protein